MSRTTVKVCLLFYMHSGFYFCCRAFETQKKLDAHWSKKPGHRVDLESMQERASKIEQEELRK